MKTPTAPTRFIHIFGTSLDVAREDLGDRPPRDELPQDARFAGPPISGDLTFGGGTTLRECAEPQALARSPLEEATEEVLSAYGVVENGKRVRDRNRSDAEWEQLILEEEARILAEPRPPAPPAPFVSRVVHAAIDARLPQRGAVEACPDPERRARYAAHFALACSTHPRAPEAVLSTSQRAVLENAADYGVGACLLTDEEAAAHIGKIPGLVASAAQVSIVVADARRSGYWPEGLVSKELDAAADAIVAARAAADARAAELEKVAKTPIAFVPASRGMMAFRIEADVTSEDLPACIPSNPRAGDPLVALRSSPHVVEDDGACVFFNVMPAPLAKHATWARVRVSDGIEILASDEPVMALPNVVNAPARQHAPGLLKKVLDVIEATIDARPMTESELRDRSTLAGRRAVGRFRKFLETIEPRELGLSVGNPHHESVRRFVVERGVRAERLAPEVVLDEIGDYLRKKADFRTPDELANLAERRKWHPDYVEAPSSVAWQPADIGKVIDAAMAGGAFCSPGGDDEGIVSSFAGATVGALKRLVVAVTGDPRETIVKDVLRAGGAANRPVRSEEIVRALQDAGQLTATVKPADHAFIKATAARSGWTKKNVALDGAIGKAFVRDNAANAD